MQILIAIVVIITISRINVAYSNFSYLFFNHHALPLVDKPYLSIIGISCQQANANTPPNFHRILLNYWLSMTIIERVIWR